MKKVILLLFVWFSLSLMCLFGLNAQESWNLKNFTTSHYNKNATLDSAIARAIDSSAYYPDNALSQLKQLYDDAQQLHYTDGIINILLSTGSLYLKQKADPLKALFYLRTAHNYLNKTASGQKETFAIRWDNCMSSAYIALDKYDSAMFHLVAALNIVAARDPKTNEGSALEIAMLYNNVSVVYMSLGQHEKSLLYLKKEEELMLKDKLMSRYVTAYLGFVYNYLDQKKFDSAAFYIQKIEDKKLVLPPLEKIYLNLAYGSFYSRQGKTDKAIPYLKQVLAISEANKPDLYSVALSNLAAAYLCSHDFKKATYYFHLAVTKKDQLKTPDYVLANIYNNLSILNDSLKNYKQAYYYRTLSDEMKEQINNTAKSKNINELETRYRVAENEKALVHKKLELLSSENKLNKRSLQLRGIISIAVVLFLLSIFFIQYQHLKLNKAKMQQQLQKNAELKAIIESEEKERNRIGHQLHDDVMVEFSIVKMNMAALPRLYPEIRQIKDFRDITKQLTLASIKLRQTAHNLMPGMLTEEGLLSAINYFCNGVQKTTGLSIDFQHYGNIPRLSVDMEISLYRMVQELVQNVIKHARASSLLVRISYGDGDMNIMVADNGKGIHNVSKALDGMGLKSIALRLQAVQGEIEIKPAIPHGTSVQIDLRVHPTS